jgi:putative SOS response-associated peptidase YedK
MCGRYSYFGPFDNLKESFHIDVIDKEPTENFNVAPTQHVPAILRDADQNYLKRLHWGLIPFWAKDPAIGSRMINARAETLAEKPSFKNAFIKRRCLILANGYYEWTAEKGGKQPYFIATTSGNIFAFAGLWETWKNKDDETTIQSCTIITTDASPQIAHLHHRMPVILSAGFYQNWLDPGLQDVGELQEILRVGKVQEFAFHPVSKVVNSVRNNGPKLIRAIEAD